MREISLCGWLRHLLCCVSVCLSTVVCVCVCVCVCFQIRVCVCVCVKVKVCGRTLCLSVCAYICLSVSLMCLLVSLSFGVYLMEFKIFIISITVLYVPECTVISSRRKPANNDTCHSSLSSIIRAKVINKRLHFQSQNSKLNKYENTLKNK